QEVSTDDLAISLVGGESRKQRRRAITLNSVPGTRGAAEIYAGAKLASIELPGWMWRVSAKLPAWTARYGTKPLVIYGRFSQITGAFLLGWSNGKLMLYADTRLNDGRMQAGLSRAITQPVMDWIYDVPSFREELHAEARLRAVI